MNHWIKSSFAVALPFLLTGCLWGPGRFASTLELRKDGSFTLDYRGEILLQIPADDLGTSPWKNEMAHCHEDAGNKAPAQMVAKAGAEPARERPCTAAEITAQKLAYDKAAAAKRKQAEQMATMFGLPGFDDASSRAFATKLMKYAGWRAVTYRGNGIFDVDYHLDGSAKQDFVFPAFPDNDLLLPFIAIRRRSDGSVLVTAPALTGGAGPLMARMAAAGASDSKTSMVSHAQGRFTIITDGEILTNNSEDGPAPERIGHALHWDIGPASKKIPETLIHL